MKAERCTDLSSAVNYTLEPCTQINPFFLKLILSGHSITEMRQIIYYITVEAKFSTLLFSKITQKLAYVCKSPCEYSYSKAD